MIDKNPIKVFHLRSSAGLYGAETVILHLCREADRMGCKSHVCCINNLKNPHAELFEEAQKIGIEASTVDSIGLMDWEAIREIRKQLKDGGFRILHCHDYKASIYGLVASWGLPVRRVVTNHLWDAIDWKLWVYQRIEGFSYNWFDRIIGVSERVKRDVRPYILHKSKIEVITNGIDCEQFSGQGNREERMTKRKEKRERWGLGEDDVVIGIVGRLVRQKGHAYLLKAFARLLAETQEHKDTRAQESKGTETQEHKDTRAQESKGTETQEHKGAEGQEDHHVSCDWCHETTKSLKLLVIGDGHLEMPLKALCRELDLPVFDIRDFHDQIPPAGMYPPGAVIFTGVLNDMPQVYPVLDLMVMPSLQEGLPMALLEALAAGVPVAASLVGQIPQIIRDGETGFLIDPQDVEGMAGIVKKVTDTFFTKSQVSTLKSQENVDLSAIVQQARELVETEHSSRAMARKYLETYEWLAEL